MNNMIETDYMNEPNNTACDSVPGSFGLPLIGHTIKFVTEPFETMHKIRQRDGLVGKLSIGGTKMVLALGPELMQELMLDPDKNYSAKMGLDSTMGPYFDGGLLVRDFADHKMHRRIMQSAFKTTAMCDYTDEVNNQVASHLVKWEQMDNFKMFPLTKPLLLDIGASVFLGLELGGENNKLLNDSFIDLMEGSFGIIKKEIPGFAHNRGMKGRRALEKFFNELVPLKRGKEGKDMASYMCNEKDEAGEYYPKEDIGKHLFVEV